MFKFLGKGLQRKEKEYLLELRRIIEERQAEEQKKQFESLSQKMDGIIARLRDLEEKVEGISEASYPQAQARLVEESSRKKNVKKLIMDTLRENKKLTSSQLSELIKLSRTRCNEYLKELEREEIAEGVIMEQKKFYRLRKHQA